MKNVSGLVVKYRIYQGWVRKMDCTKDLIEISKQDQTGCRSVEIRVWCRMKNITVRCRMKDISGLSV